MARKSSDEFNGTAIGDAGPLGDDGSGVVDPVSLGGGEDFERDDNGAVIRKLDGTPRRKRGRRSGGSATAAASGSRTRQKSAVSLTGVEAILLSAHAMLAAATKQPGLALEKDEAEQLAKAVAEVAKHYDTSVDPKHLAWFNLVAIVAMIYGPRIFMLSRGKSSTPETEAEPAVFAGNVTGLNFVAGTRPN